MRWGRLGRCSKARSGRASPVCAAEHQTDCLYASVPEIQAPWSDARRDFARKKGKALAARDYEFDPSATDKVGRDHAPTLVGAEGKGETGVSGWMQASC